MNYLGLRSKSLFFSLGIHLGIAIAIVIVFYQLQETNTCACGSMTKVSKINLSTVSFEPTSMPVEKTIQKEVEQTKPTTEPKNIRKNKVEIAKPDVKQVEVKQEVEVAKEEPISEEIKKEKKEMKVAQSVLNNVAAQPALENVTKVKSKEDLRIACEKAYIQDNLSLINALIKQHLYYPRMAKKRGMQGETMVAFMLNTRGEITEIRTLGSVSSILSRAAIKTVKKAAESFPHPKVDLSLQIPIVYKLAQR